MTSNTPRLYELNAQSKVVLPAAAEHIYEGMALGDSSGTARILQAGDVFLGFANEECSNAGSSGLTLEILQRGVATLLVTGVTSTDDIGATVYASDSSTFTLSSTGNTSIGKIIKWESATKCRVAFESASRRSI